MSSATRENVLEPHARYLAPGAMLFINADASWSVGPSTQQLVKVSFGSFSAVDDASFGWSAVAVERAGAGWRLLVRNDADEDQLVQLQLDAAGRADAASLALLGQADLWAAEERLALDLNDSGGLGAGPVLLQGGAANLYMSELGHYQVGAEPARVTLTLGGAPLDDQLLPAGWEIVETQPAAQGFDVYAQAPDGALYIAQFDAAGAYASGRLVSGTAIDELERSLGLDLDHDADLPAPAGWTTLLKTDFIRSAVNQGLGQAGPQAAVGVAGAPVLALQAGRGAGEGEARPLAGEPAGVISHAELVAMLQTLVRNHREAGNTPLSAQELADLQALAARGKAVFGGNSSVGDYLSYAFSRLVEGSDANRFYTGGSDTRSDLGSLAAGSSVDLLDKLIGKWLLGTDLPSARTAGDTATGSAQAVAPVYARSAGELFVEGVTVNDVVQGTAGDCYLIAAMGGLAGSRPAAIEALFVDNGVVDGARSWGVRFFDAAGRAHWVTVNDMLPVVESGSTQLAYAGSAGKQLNGEVWVPLLEKAYAQTNALGILPRAETTGQNSYAAIEGGQGDPLAQLLGGKLLAYTDPGSGFGDNGFLTTRHVDRSDAAARSQLVTELAAAINGGHMVWIGVSTSVKDSLGNQLLVGSHAHYALDADPADPGNTTVLVYNPWGLQAQTTPPSALAGGFVSPVPYTLADLVGIAGLDFMVLEGAGG